MRTFAVGTKIFGGLATFWGAVLSWPKRRTTPGDDNLVSQLSPPSGRVFAVLQFHLASSTGMMSWYHLSVNFCANCATVSA